MLLRSFATLVAVSVLAAIPVTVAAQDATTGSNSTADNPTAPADSSACDPKDQACAAPQADASFEADKALSVQPNGDAGNPKPMVPTCDPKSDPNCPS